MQIAFGSPIQRNTNLFFFFFVEKKKSKRYWGNEIYPQCNELPFINRGKKKNLTLYGKDSSFVGYKFYYTESIKLSITEKKRKIY